MKTLTEGEKPAYLGLLNTIANAETNAGVYLRAWADVTDNDDLACTLRFVAARETSHGEVFCRRIHELGFELRRKPDPEAAARLARVANPDLCDLDKLPPRNAESGDPFKGIKQGLEQGEYDALTANLLSWYITEEYDSARRLREAYSCVRETVAGGRARINGAPSHDAEAMMACMTAGFARLEKSIEKLAKAVK